MTSMTSSGSKLSDLQDSFQRIEVVANESDPILLVGGIEAGRRFFAQSVHDLGIRHGKPFAELNLAEVTAQRLSGDRLLDVVESGVKQAWEDAPEGTVILHRIDGISRKCQQRLLSVLTRIGDLPEDSKDASQKIPTRVVATTDINLPMAIREGAFEKDLYNYFLPALKLLF